MVNSPLVSVVVPVYKCERYIEKCILSIVGQTYQNLEIIVVIDGTFDRSGEICNQIAKDDKRIVVVEKNNEGVSVARNVGLRLAKGEWISFVDGDDWLEKTYIEDLISITNANRADIVLCV